METNETNETIQQKPTLSAQELDRMPAAELQEQRSRFGKVFAMEGGNHQAVTYTDPVHYLNADTETWEEIDNTLVKDECGGIPCLRNTANSLQVICTQSGAQPFLHLVDETGNTISYGIEGAKEVFPEISHHEPTADTGNEVYLQREKVLQTQEGSARYAGILPGIDMVFTALPSGLKDTLWFQTPSSVDDIVFQFAVSKAQMTLDAEKNRIIVTDNTGKELFWMPMPYLIDATGETGDVQVTLVQEDDLWKMRCAPDPEFIKAATFPVALDPAVYTQNQSTNIQDTYVRSNRATNNYSTLNQLWVADNSTYGIRYSYLKVNSLPPIKAANYITKAYLCLSLYTRPSSNTAVFLSEVTSPFTASTLTYSTRPSQNSLYQDYIYTSTSQSISSYYQFDVSSLVRKWYLGTNYGVVLMPQAENSNTVRFWSMQGTRKPYLVVNYNSMAGLESHLTYDERSLGRAGTSYVSLYNGNMVFTHSDSNQNGQRMPASIGHVYNSCDAHQRYWYMGYGWRSTLHLTLHRETIPDQNGTNVLYYVYTDSDGTLHHMKNNGSGTYVDLDGLSLKLTLNTGAGTATLTDKENTRIVFGLPTSNRTSANYASATKMVRTISDAQGNTLTVASSGLKITSVTDGAGRVTTFGYDSSNRCSYIKAPGQSSTNCVRFAYNSSSNLTTITHEDNVTSTYTYNANHLMLTASNADGRVFRYTYSNANTSPSVGLPYRVTEFSITNGSSTDERRSYTYGSRLTVSKNLTYSGGKSLTYHFNDYGNLVSVHDELGQASFTAFAEGALPNHPDSISRVQKSVTNLILDHSIEKNSSLWSTGGTGTFSRDQTVFHMGLVSRKITITAGHEAYCKQSVSLTPGKSYTFSSYIKTSGSVHAQLRIVYTSGSTKTVNSEHFYNLTSFTRESVSFTLPSTASSNVTFYLVCNTNAGTAWFDCVQLESGLTLNRYNMLENSSFSRGGNTTLPYGWVKESTSSNSYYSTSRPANQPSFLPGRSVRMKGRYNRSIQIWHEMRAYGNAGDVYVAGGWTCGFGKEVRPITGRTIRNFINVLFLCGSNWVSGGKVYFNYEDGNWQFVSGAVKAPNNYTYIRFIIQYSQQINYADFTNMFLYKEEFGNTFTYDSRGNIVSVSTAAGKKGSATYDAFDNLTSYVQPGRSSTIKTTLEYGTTDTQKKKHLLLKSTNPVGVKNSFQYDSKGNNTLSQIQNGTGSSFIRSTTAYTANQNYVASQTDARGKTVTSNIDQTKGLLNSVTDPNGQTVSYGYDARKRITSASSTANGKTYRNEYVYSQDRLSHVKHNTASNATCDVDYSFTYNAFGKPLVTKIGTQTLSTNNYDATKGTLSSVSYGNGDRVTYIRDTFNRVIGQRFEGDSANRFSYDYTVEGAVGHVQDNHLSRTHRMEYDLAGRLMRVTTRAGSSHIHTGELTYDSYNNLSAFKEKVGTSATAYTTTYAYDNANRPTNVQFGSTSNKVTYTYDTRSRVNNRALKVNGTNHASSYGFVAGGHGTGSVTNLVSSITQSGQNLSYTYDDVGNITAEVRGSYTTSYGYDNLGQLTRVNDQRAGATWTFEYDRGGNILSKSRYAYTTGTLGTAVETIAYTYNTTWKDKLASYSGNAITYDAIGNPLTYDGWTFAWRAGRQLASMSKTGTSASFNYNANGLRVRKTVNGTVTDYTLHGKQIVHLKKGSNNLHFFYDAQGKPSIVDFNGTKYGYIHNLQGDIISIIDGNGNQVVEYSYDAWGKPLTKTGTLATTLGTLNPFRYRGYVYDEETGLYYLRSRYYNPVWGRFLNADSVLGKPGQLLGHNVFTYCRNSPIVHSDRMGNSPVAISALNDESFWIREIYLLSGDEFDSAFDMLDGKFPEDDYLEPSEEAFRNIVMNLPGVSSKKASILSFVHNSVEPFISYNNEWGKSLTSITARSLLSNKGYSYVTIDLVHGPGGAIIRIATYDKNGVPQNQTPAAKPFLSNNLWGVNQLIHYMRENFLNNMLYHESLQTELDKVY